MRPLVLAICLLAFVPGASGCGGGDESELTKSEFVADLEEQLGEEGLPGPFTECFGSSLKATLYFSEMEKARDSLPDPDSASPAEIEQAVGPRVMRDYREATVTCARKSIRSKDLTPGELKQILEALRPV